MRIFVLSLLVVCLVLEATALRGFSATSLFQAKSSPMTIDQSSHISQAIYLRRSNQIYVVGTIYGTDDVGNTTAPSTFNKSSTFDHTIPKCFVGLVNLTRAPPATKQLANTTTGNWISDIGEIESDTAQACYGLSVDMEPSRLFVVGSFDPYHGSSRQQQEFHRNNKSLTTTMRQSQVKEMGTVMQLTMDRNVDNSHFWFFQERQIIQETALTFPLMVATSLPDTEENQRLYVASMVTNQVARDDEERLGVFGSGSNFPAGFSYALEIRSYQVTDRQAAFHRAHNENSSLTLDTTQEFRTLNGESVHLTGLLQLSDRLVVSGYTAGSGPGLGNAANTDMDGFVMQLDLETLELLRITGTGDPMTAQTRRIQSIPGLHDWVQGMCVYEDPDPQVVQEFLYIVGSSQGFVDGAEEPTGSTLHTTRAVTKSTRAYLQKLRLADMSVVWTAELEAEPAWNGKQAVVQGLDCTVASDGNTVYFAGNVENGALIVGSGLGQSHGKTDVFVALVKADDGELLGMEQIGSEGQDFLAYRGGLFLDGNQPIIVINTEGHEFRTERSATTNGDPWLEILLFNMSTYGGYREPQNEYEQVNNGQSAGEQDKDYNMEKTTGPFFVFLIVLFFLVNGVAYSCWPERAANVRRRRRSGRK